MNQVTIKTTDLLMKVRENRDKHRENFLKAQIGYRAKVVEELDRMLSEAKSGAPIRRAISLPEPEDHTDDYNRVVKMLEMSAENTVTVSVHEFENYVMDNWPWSGLVSRTTSLYTQPTTKG